MRTLQSNEDVDPKTKEIWEKVLVAELMSSEDESIVDDEKMFVVRQPTWRSSKYSKFVHKLDEIHKESGSTKSRFRMLKRTVGDPSSKDAPTNIKAENKWVLKE